MSSLFDVTKIIMVTSLLTFMGCKDKDQGNSGYACGSSDASSSLIKGPAVGSDGNNSDNPFRALAIHPTDPQTIYIGSEGNGLFKSTDGGANFTWLRNGLLHCNAYPEIYSISIDSSNPNHLAIATNSGPGSVSSGITSIAGMYESQDAGASWQQYNSGLPNADVNSALILSNGDILAGLGAGSSTNAGDTTFYNGGIYLKPHGGNNWSEVTSTSARQSLFWQLLNRSSGLIAFGGNPITGTGSGIGLIKSTDNGYHWNATTTALSGLAGGYIEASNDLQTIYACKRSGESSPIFYKSVNGGSTWTNPASVGNSASGPVKIVGSDPNIALASLGSSLVRTTNGFSTVTTVLTTPSSNNQIVSIEVAPSNSNYVYVTTKGLLVYRSTDGGVTFSLRGNIRTFIDSH